jgi:Ser/Thr protein kinase RdoA (MazF antagonist)
MLTPAHAKRIAAEYGLGDDATMSGPVARGELGQIWRLETTRGAFAVKEWFEKFPQSELLEGAAFQEAAGWAGVPCPKVVRRGDGSLLLDLAATTICLYGWVDLCDRNPLIDPAAVGSLVGTLHRVPYAGREPIDPWYSEPIGGDRWDELVRQLRDRGAPFAEGLAAFRDELVALEALIVPPANLRTCHRDLWADNLRATPGGGLCLIDWDNAGDADPAMELALVLFEFGRGDPNRARELHQAYMDAGGPGRVRGRGDFSMPIAQLGHIGERGCRLWLATETDGDRARAVAIVDAFVTDALTRDVIADLLDAIGTSWGLFDRSSAPAKPTGTDLWE